MDPDRKMKQGDTWPPLRGEASDSTGPLDLSTATAVQVRLKSDTHIVTGIPTVLHPPVADADGIHFWNWEYEWAAGDTDNVGVYNVELVVTWAPGEVETFPNDGAEQLLIEARAT